jgi:hypothetical protein
MGLRVLGIGTCIASLMVDRARSAAMVDFMVAKADIRAGALLW